MHDIGVGTSGESLQRAEIVPGSLPRKVGNGISFRNYSAEYSRNGFCYSAEESAHSEVYGKVNFEARNGTELHGKKFVLQKILLQ